MKIKLILTILSLLPVSYLLSGKEYTLTSPDNISSLVVKVEDITTYTLYRHNKVVVSDCQVGLELLSGEKFGWKTNVLSVNKATVKRSQTAVVPNKSKTIIDNFNALELSFEGDYMLTFRLYNNGMAYRFETNFKDTIQVVNETAEFNFPAKTISYFPQEERLISHYERLYKVFETGQMTDTQFCSLPVYFNTSEGIRALITEADLSDYPGMFLQSDGKGGLHSLFPKVITKIEPHERYGDRYEKVLEEAGYIAETNGTRTLPWRVIMLGDTDAAIAENQMVYLLSSDNKIDDPSWIKPGKVAWDWWNANNIYNVDFESGINNRTYKYYIDFAAEFGLGYIILDEGWSKTTTNLTECREDIDVKELVTYGREKNVGIILWVLWKPLDKDLENILRTYNNWGVKGIKVDFMQRTDQYMVNYYTRVAEMAAKYRLIVDFHGAFKPSGLRKAYPNVLSFEGVKGLENNKWGKEVTPRHDVTLPFTRMVAGPMDYTPGAMDNAMGSNFFDRFSRPMSQGTRAHQVAMYIVYESPLQMLADNPSNYYREEPCTRFIAKIPVTWDETHVLEGEIADYIIVARKKGKAWYIGAMSDENTRDFEIDLSFIPEQFNHIEYLSDGINAHKVAIDYSKAEMDRPDDNILKIHLAPGGGFAAILTEK